MQKSSLTTPFLAQASRLRQAGRLAEAIAPLRQAAALEPANPEILHDLGLTLLQTGHTAQAVQALRSAIARRETFAHAHWRLGNALESLGDMEGAMSSYRTALSHDPSLFGAEFRLGGLLETTGHHSHAAECYRRASARQPKPASYVTKSRALILEGRTEDAERLLRRAIAHDRTHAPAHSQLGLLLHQRGDPVAAIESCQRAVEFDPRNPDFLNNLGNICRAQGQFEKAVSVLRQAVLLSPENAVFHVNLGNLLIDLKRPDEAAGCYRRAIAIRPDLARAHHGLAMSQNLMGNAESAIEAYRAAIASAPGQAALWNDLGRTLRSLGRFSEAADSFRQALAIDPDFADGYRNLASCRQLVDGNADIAHVAALCERPDLPVEERVIAGFTLGKLFDDANRFDEAFDAYARSNAAYRLLRAARGENFDAEALRRAVDETIASVTAASVAAPASWGNPSELPVFIVGMPRSGTSLVEQIAASHSRVFGAGELKHIGDLAATLGNGRAAWQRADIRRLSDAHIERLQAMGGGAAARVIDKLPDNVFKLGFIAALFPSARIIFCHRDPRDIGLSCFFQKFSAGQMTFSSSLFDCGIRCYETHRLIEHWHVVLPLRMLDVSYEALVADLENESRRIVAFLGLAWEPACLDFHQSQRTVMTASAWQVRQPLYDRSVGRWRNYEGHLGPLLAGLSGQR